jgi:hypothetical protein
MILEPNVVDELRSFEGRVVQAARVGVGSFFTLYLDEVNHEVIWIQNAEWRITGGDRLLGGSGDHEGGMGLAVSSLSGEAITRITVNGFLDVSIAFSNEFAITALNTYGESDSDVTLWSFFLADTVISGKTDMHLSVESNLQD